MEANEAVEKIVDQALEDALARLRRGECNPEVLAYVAERVNAESKGYFNEESFSNYDEARRILGIGSRETLKAVLDRNGIKMRKIKNQRVGFLRNEVEALKSKLLNRK